MHLQDDGSVAPSGEAIAIDVIGDDRALPAPSSVAGDRQTPLLKPSQAPQHPLPEFSWFHRLAVALGVSGEETIGCPVCFDSIPVSQSVALRACGHRYCRPCLTIFLELNIRDGQVYPKCFYEVEREATSGETSGLTPCSAPIDESDIDDVVSDALRTKYHTFRFNQENEFGRQCPYCGHSQICDGPKNPACMCDNCGGAYCFLHANAHRGRQCEQYEREQLRRDRETRTTIARIAKECPKCKTKIEKDGGCNHLKCTRCRTDFCWMCGAIVEDSDLPNHFQWWNLRGCAGLMRAEIRQDTLCQRIMAKTLSVLNFVFIGPASFLLTVVLTIATLGCLPCVCFAEMSFSTTFMLGMELCGWILLLPLTLLDALYRKCKRSCCTSRQAKLPTDPPAAELDNDDPAEAA